MHKISIFRFFIFVSGICMGLSMGMYLHNSICSASRVPGKKSSFVRTPNSIYWIWKTSHNNKYTSTRSLDDLVWSHHLLVFYLRHRIGHLFRVLFFYPFPCSFDVWFALIFYALRHLSIKQCQRRLPVWIRSNGCSFYFSIAFSVTIYCSDPILQPAEPFFLGYFCFFRQHLLFTFVLENNIQYSSNVLLWLIPGLLFRMYAVFTLADWSPDIYRYFGWIDVQLV